MASVNCSLFKITRYDTLVFRNSETGKKAGISREVDYVPMSVCGLCKSLRVGSPDHLKAHLSILDTIIKHTETMATDKGFLTPPQGEA